VRYSACTEPQAAVILAASWQPHEFDTHATNTPGSASTQRLGTYSKNVVSCPDPATPIITESGHHRLDHGVEPPPRPPCGQPLSSRQEGRILAWIFLTAVVLQTACGGLVAGLKAGYMSRTWPLMYGKLVPSALWNAYELWWRGLIEPIGSHWATLVGFRGRRGRTRPHRQRLARWSRKGWRINCVDPPRHGPAGDPAQHV
jgi:hypothetical protein